MYNDLTTEELQAWLLAEAIQDDAILEPDAVWDASQVFRTEVRDRVYVRQCLNEEDIEADIY